MDKSSATTVGKVAAPVVDPVTQRVLAFRIKSSKGPGDVLLWDAVAGLGPDALTVDSMDQIMDAPAELKDRASKSLDLIGRQVLTEHGHSLGSVKDVEFSPKDGAVTSLILKDQYVDGERLIGIGSFAVVVRG